MSFIVNLEYLKAALELMAQAGTSGGTPKQKVSLLSNNGVI